MADQEFMSLAQKTSPTAGSNLLMVNSSEAYRIDYDKLADAMLNKLTSKNYSSLETAAKNIIAALNELNSKSLIYRGSIPNDADLDDYKVSDDSHFPGVYYLNGYNFDGATVYGPFILFRGTDAQMFIRSNSVIYIRSYSGSPASWRKWSKFAGESLSF